MDWSMVEWQGVAMAGIDRVDLLTGSWAWVAHELSEGTERVNQGLGVVLEISEIGDSRKFPFGGGPISKCLWI